MKLSRADIEAWSLVADVLPRIAEEEVELLPLLANTVHDTQSSVGSQPGAFNAAEVTSIAIAAYALVIDVLRQYAPKLFDAGIEVAKDYFSKRFDTKQNKPAAPTSAPNLNLQELRSYVFELGARHGLDDIAKDAIANAIVARLAILQQKNP